MRANKALSIAALILLGALTAAACGGQSLVHSDDDSSMSGDAGTGQSGRGGTSNGGGGTSGIGGASTGGIAGTIDTGGSGGNSVGGSSVGGVAGTSGSAGIAGAGGICSLPLESGPCDGYAPSFGFSQADGNCQSFVYGLCGGNENRFSTLAECEAKCGGSLSACPSRQPGPTECSKQGEVCTYDFDYCLCAPRQPYDCSKVDRACMNFPDAGVSEIVIVAYTRCTCESGRWNCQVVTYGGGPP